MRSRFKCRNQSAEMIFFKIVPKYYHCTENEGAEIMLGLKIGSFIPKKCFCCFMPNRLLFMYKLWFYCYKSVHSFRAEIDDDLDISANDAAPWL